MKAHAFSDLEIFFFSRAWIRRPLNFPARMAAARWFLALAVLTALLGLAHADIYMHNMRGSNNRLDGANTNVGNNKRLFDSQNNDKGGYNHGYAIIQLLWASRADWPADTCTTMQAASLRSSGRISTVLVATPTFTRRLSFSISATMWPRAFVMVFGFSGIGRPPITMLTFLLPFRHPRADHHLGSCR